MHIQVTGKSSGKTLTIEINSSDHNKSMLNFLRENKVGIASSCRGERICHLCIINTNVLSCALTVENFVKEHGYQVSVDYL